MEPAARRLVADQLGVSAADLAPATSLLDDLAADSLDVVELGLVLETTWGITIPERALDAVRTYADVVDAVVASLVAQRRSGRRAEPVLVRARIVPMAGGSVEIAEDLTPYTVEILVEDALRAGPGARLEMELPAATDDAGLAAAHVRLAPLAARGVEVSVRRGEQSPRPAA